MFRLSSSTVATISDVLVGIATAAAIVAAIALGLIAIVTPAHATNAPSTEVSAQSSSTATSTAQSSSTSNAASVATGGQSVSNATGGQSVSNATGGQSNATGGTANALGGASEGGGGGSATSGTDAHSTVYFAPAAILAPLASGSNDELAPESWTVGASSPFGGVGVGSSTQKVTPSAGLVLIQQANAAKMVDSSLLNGAERQTADSAARFLCAQYPYMVPQTVCDSVAD